jgi:hypothetical protein
VSIEPSQCTPLVEAIKRKLIGLVQVEYNETNNYSKYTQYKWEYKGSNCDILAIVQERFERNQAWNMTLHPIYNHCHHIPVTRFC